ncbi:TonB-dependent receptor [Segetibacter koreensis]|uniref:TonB-dependent receptor n=1 Tax=Segetibacter koreensis TaxID=398037 RepID=UPI000371788D|nr:TonB-dependent receptor [Segetibacter koreensis]
MKQILLLQALVVFTINALSAQIKIAGIVKDNKNHPLPGASIAIANSYDGATTDSSGAFSFRTTEKGEHIITASSIGYNTFEQKIDIDKEPIKLSISLKEKLDELKAVMVTAGSFAAGDSKRAAVLSSLDVATTAGSNADITAALKTLPGTQQVGEQEGLFVRGGAGYETKQFIDGTLVNNPYFSSVPDIASRGRFSPFLFKGTVFTTGGYSALYGQALSSALLLESIDLPEKSEIDASISPLLAGLGTQQLAKNKKSSWGINYSYVNVSVYFKLVKQTPDYFKIPQFHNGDANFRFKTKRGGMVKYYTTFSYGKLGLRRPDIDSLHLKDAFGLTNYNWYNNLSWRENLGNGWKMNLGTSYSTNKDNISQQIQDQSNQPKEFVNGSYWMQNKNFGLQHRQDLSQLRAVFEKKLVGISSVRFGSEYWYSYDKSFIHDSLYKLIDNYTSVFAETEIYLTNDLAAKAGVRFENSSLIHKADIAPRLSLAYKTGKDAQMSVAYGIFYQKPENNQLYYSTSLGMTKAAHYIINYQKMTHERIFRVEVYYKKYENLIKTIPAINYTFGFDNNGAGYAKGIDVFWRDKKSLKNFDYWLSYSYIDTKRDYLNYPKQLQPNFVANHTASVVMKRFFTKIKSGFNFTYSYASGRPYYNLIINSNNKYFIADEGKTKSYNSLNFSAEWVPSIGKINAKTFIVLFASMTNVLGQNQVYGYNYSYNGMYKEPIMPPAKRFYFIGCFLSWGVDRSQDAINNNL